LPPWRFSQRFNPPQGSDGKPLVWVLGTALLSLNARQRHFDIAGQGLLDHLGIEGAQVGSNPAQQFPIGFHRAPLTRVLAALHPRLRSCRTSWIEGSDSADKEAVSDHEL
jgi:hypothetical protein